MTGPGASERLIKRSLLLALSLTALKTAAGILGNSLGILASALDSFTDVGASSVNLLSLRLSALPPDRLHPYGRGKAEALAGLAQSAFIAASGVGLLAESLRRLVRGADVAPGWFGFAVMGLAAALSLWHSVGLAAALRESDSTVMRTEKAHFAMDFLANLGVILALLAVKITGSARWDLAISLLITAYILYEAWKVMAYSVSELLDRGLPPEVLREIESAIRDHHPSVVGFHDLRTRKSGSRYFVEFHIEIRKVKDFDQAHEITEDLIDRVRRKLPNADVTVHYDPEGGR